MRHALRLIAVICLCTPVLAQWSADPAVNLALADGSAGQVLPLIGSTSDGGTYVAWFDNASGNFDVYLQRLNAAGVEMWPHNGLLISDHPQNSALFGWHMIVDSEDNAVLVFSDERDGNDLDIQAYRVSPAGELLWGPNGVTLSDNPDFEPAPRVAQTSDGDFVFVWARLPNVGDGDLRMQRLSPAGSPQLTAGGIPVVSSTGESPGFVNVVPASDADVVLSWLRDISSLFSQRHLRAGRFSNQGGLVWDEVVEVYDAFALPLGYAPSILSDGDGGVLLLWHRSDGNLFNSFVQHLDASGNELFAHNGIAVSSESNRHHLDPAFTHNRTTGEILVFWNERNPDQNQWGISGQRFSAGGFKLWGVQGIELLPVNTKFKSAPRVVGLPEDVMVFLVDSPSGNDRLIGMRVNTAGNEVWPGSPIVLSSAASSKSRYPATIDRYGVGKLVWEDDRNASTDLYAQNVFPDGSLGVAPDPGDVSGLRIDRLEPGSPDLLLAWQASCTLGALDYAIYEGPLDALRDGDGYEHAMNDCTDDFGDLREWITPGGGNAYYLVVAYNQTDEGSHGTDSASTQRPTPLPADRCVASQAVVVCP